jgi:hypothetical protein
MEYKLLCSIEYAPQLDEWLKAGRGIAVWQSINLSNPGGRWLTPAVLEDGTPLGKPNWQAANIPEAIITAPAEIGLLTYKEVKRFYVAVRRGSQGLSLKLTDGATRKVRRAVAKAGDGAVYSFDYVTQEAVISVPAETISMVEWLERQPAN